MGKGPAEGGGEDRQPDNGREGGTDSTATGRRGNRLGGQTIKQEGWQTIFTTGKQEEQAGSQKEGGADDNPTTGGREERGDGQHNRRGRPRQRSRRDGGQAIKQDEGA